ncbi:MAG: hypothetical protein C4524_12560 [Candidatus Zixiibacteriota bacterium]|nr:MAG: hypothetical protein C4524_12560 [candidate division Zixibacteria bacterium]
MPRFLFALALLLTAALARPAPAQQDTWRVRGTDQVVVHFHSGDEPDVEGLIQAVEQALPTMEARLGVTLEQPAYIYLAASQQEFDRLTGGKLPVWSQGVSFPESGAIVLKSPQFSRDREGSRMTTRHELVHILISRKAGTSVPRWLNEGLALMLSGEGEDKPLMPLSRSLWSGGLLSLESIERVDAFPHATAELAYLQSYHATQFLVKQHGWEALRRMLDDLKQGRYWEDALFNETEMDQAGFEAAWRADLESSYRWIILLDLDIILFSGVAIMLIVGAILMVRRRRKIYRQWEAEDGAQEGNF